MTADRVEIVNVSGGYGAAKIVHGVSFTAEPASVTVLIGGNGAGKTTIMRLIAGLLIPAFIACPHLDKATGSCYSLLSASR